MPIRPGNLRRRTRRKAGGVSGGIKPEFKKTCQNLTKVFDLKLRRYFAILRKFTF